MCEFTIMVPNGSPYWFLPNMLKTKPDPIQPAIRFPRRPSLHDNILPSAAQLTLQVCSEALIVAMLHGAGNAQLFTVPISLMIFTALNTASFHGMSLQRNVTTPVNTPPINPA